MSCSGGGGGVDGMGSHGAELELNEFVVVELDAGHIELYEFE